MRKRILLIALSIFLCVFLLTACAQAGTPVQYDSPSELSKAVGFNVVNPQNVPEGFALAGYYAVGENLAQIAYLNGENDLIFAMTDLKKIECGQGAFDQTKSVDVNGVSFELSLSDGSVHLAVAHAGGYTYAIYSKSGLAEDTVVQMAGGLGLAAHP